MAESETAAKIRVAVVFGGRSSEHSISCLTAAGVLGALDPNRYEVIGVGITRSGKLVVAGPDVIGRLTVGHDAQGGETLPELSDNADEAMLVHAGSGGEIVRREQNSLAALGAIDVAFSLLHGPFGEDGTIQGMFEMAGVRYVGAGVLASAVGMDKHYMKLVLAASGLPVGPYVVITPGQWQRDRPAVLDAISALSYPLYVKPARGGSSLGIRRVDDPQQLEPAIEFAREFDPKVIVEQGFSGARELECGVLESPGGAPPEVSPVAEIRMHTASGFYDFEAKYLPEHQVDLDVPAVGLDPVVTEDIRALAARTFEAIGCEGLARVDFFLTRDNRVVINEINTMPGFTEHSMFPRVWAAGGLSYPELVDRLLSLALQRPTGLR